MARGRVMTQFLPRSPERRYRADLDPGDAPAGSQGNAASRRRLIEARRSSPRSRITNCRSAMSSERLLYRLFHEQA